MSDIDDIVFPDTQIARGIRPLAQSGTVVVGADKTLTLYGTKGDVIATAPLDQVTAKPGVALWRHMVFLDLAGQRFNCTPSWAKNRWNGILGLLDTKASKALVAAIASGGQRTPL